MQTHTAFFIYRLTYPCALAKKLKRSWVEVQKIKSKWKAQKRKEGLITARPVVHLEEGEAAKDNSSDEDDSAQGDEMKNGTSEEEDNDSGSENEEGESEDEDMTVQEKVPIRSQGVKRGGRGSRGRGTNVRGRGGSSKQRTTDPIQEEKKQSLRELQNQAYSRSSLHTFKSGSHKQRDGGARGQNGRGRGRGSTGRGRGQPDMRLRMNFMLEKIKRDYA